MRELFEKSVGSADTQIRVTSVFTVSIYYDRGEPYKI